MNGHTPQEGQPESQPSARPRTPSSYLGKRKRSSSPTTPAIPGNNGRGLPDTKIENIVREIKE